MASQSSPHILQRLNTLADAAVIAAVFTVLAFQEIRFEGYEAEKAALLMIILGILAATLLCRVFVQRAGLRHIQWRHPVSVGIGLLLVSTLVSSAAALSPQVSFFGTADRSQGTLLQIGYGLLCIQAMLSAARLQKMMFPVLMVLAVPVCLFAWIVQFGFEVARPGSTMGNPNFLASWLVLGILVIGYELLGFLPNPRAGWHAWRKVALRQKMMVGYTGLILLLMLATLALTASRGALLGLIVAVFSLGGVWAAAHGRKWWLLLVTGLIAIGIGAYVAVGQSLSATRPIEEVPRFFRFFEDFRVESWTGAQYLLFEYPQPLLNTGGSPDALSALRPVIGYGLDNVAYMQGIVDVVYQRVTYLNSFHNFLIDTLVMQGGIGLVAWLLIYGGAGYGVLRRFNLLPDQWRWACLLILGVSVPATIWMVGNILWYVNVRFLLFLGAGLGLIVGLWVWLLVVAWLPRPAVAAPTNMPQSKRALLVMMLLGTLVAHWVDLQFGFVQVATEPLWWVLLGLLVAGLQPTSPDDAEKIASLSPEKTGAVWLLAAGLTGLYLIHGLGNAITSRFIGYSLGGEYLLFVLSVTLAAGMSGAYAAAARSITKWLPLIGMIVVGWALAYGIKESIVTSASAALDNLVVQPTVLPENLIAPFGLLAVKGIALVWGSWGIWVFGLWQPTDAPKRRSRRAISLPLWMLGVILLGGIIGSGYYMADYAASTLHAAGRGFAAVDSPKTYAVGLAAFRAAGQLQPNRGQLSLEEAELEMKLVRITNAPTPPDTAAEPALQALFSVQPYYHYTRPWALFCENYPVSRCAQLQDYLPQAPNP